MEPRQYIHTCPGCVYLGMYINYDLYMCRNDNGLVTTLVARFGDEAGAITTQRYNSDPFLPVFVEAKLRAATFLIQESTAKPRMEVDDMEFI